MNLGTSSLGLCGLVGVLGSVLGLVTMSWAVLHDVSCLRVVLDCLGDRFRRA